MPRTSRYVALRTFTLRIRVYVYTPADFVTHLLRSYVWVVLYAFAVVPRLRSYRCHLPFICCTLPFVTVRCCWFIALLPVRYVVGVYVGAVGRSRFVTFVDLLFVTFTVTVHVTTFTIPLRYLRFCGTI